MAESFKDQVDALTGFGTTENDALADWLTAGARSILNVLPLNKLQRIASTTTFQDSQDVEGKKIIAVMRKDENNSSKLMPCRQVSPALKGKVTDSSYMEAASTSDPVYYIENDVLNVVPTHSDSNSSSVVNIDTNITVAHGSTSISNFPDEAEYAVTLYAARQALKKLIADANNDEDVEMASSYSNQYALVDAQYKEALQILGIEEIEERKLQRDAR